MEFASSSSRPTTAAADDDVENGRFRRFPDPPPPQRHSHGDSNATVDAALLTRREELLWELHKERIRQDMILRELVETERAMGFTATGHNPVPPLPWSHDYFHCRTPFVPPCEAPIRLPCSGAQHPPCCCGSSMTVRASPMYPHVERSPSPSPLLQLQSASDAEKHQDCRSSGARMHLSSGHVELYTSPSKRTLEEETLVPVAPNACVRPMRPGSVHEKVTSTHQRIDESCELKVAVEDCRAVQPLPEVRNQKSEERVAAQFGKDDQMDEAMLWPCRYSLTGKENAAFYQQKRLEFSETAHEQTRLGNDAEQHQEGGSSGLRTDPFGGFDELSSKMTPVEETFVPVAAKASINQMLCASFCKEAASGHQQTIVGEKVGVEDGHGRQPFYEIKNRSSEEHKAIDPAFEDCINKSVQQHLQYKPADQENTANIDQKSTEFNDATGEGTSSGVKRKLTALGSPAKKQKPLGQWSCTICQANPVSQHQLVEHLAGKRHQANVAALEASRSNSPEPNTTAKPPAWRRSIATDAPEDGEVEEVPEKRWACWICQAKCTSESDYYSHLGGRRHRENMEARWHRENEEDRRRAELLKLYCVVCDLQCNGEKMLASHLGGRRHREALEGRERD